MNMADNMKHDKQMLVNLWGGGEKDINTVAGLAGMKGLS